MITHLQLQFRRDDFNPQYTQEGEINRGENTLEKDGWGGSQQASAPTTSRKSPERRKRKGSQVHRGPWGGPEYITVINGTVPQTQGAGKWSGARGTQNTSNFIKLQSVRAVIGDVYDVGGGLRMSAHVCVC